MPDPLITAGQLAALFPRLTAAQLAEYAPALNGALAEFSISTPRRVAAFLGQIGHESGGLRYWLEIWGPTVQQMRYEPPAKLAARLGNTRAGDGERYRGRGPIQLTGRANYSRAGAALGLPLEDQPDLVATPAVGFRVAGLFWARAALNELADRHTLAAYREITRGINGGFYGHHDRVVRWRAACRVLGLPEPA